MAHASNETSSPTKAPAAQREVLAELVRTATAMANEQLTGMVNRLVAAMADLTVSGIDSQVAYRRTRAANLLKSNSYAFVHIAGEAIERALRSEVDGLSPRASGNADHLLLSLVPIEETDNKVVFGTVSRPFDIAHSEVLASLCVRLGLLLGRDVLRPVQNPFRPEVFLQAVNCAWRDFEPDATAHDLLLPLLRPELFLDLGPMLEALDEALRARNKAARERFHIKKSLDTGAARRRGDMDAVLAQQLRALLNGAGVGGAAAAAGAPAADQGLVPELPNMPQGNGWRPSAVGTAGATGQGSVHGTVPAAPASAAQQGAAASVTRPYPGFASAIAPQGLPGATGFVAADGVGESVAAPHAFVPHAAQAPGRHGHSGPAHGFSHDAAAASQGATTGAPAGIAGAPGAAAAPRQGQALAAGAAAGAPVASQPGSLLGMLAGLQGMPQFSAGAVATPAAAGETHHPNVFFLPRLKQSLPQGSLSRGEENTLDLLSRIFETVLLDDGLPAETRELIHYLQVPVLKAALVDQGFFFEEAHPARRMIDLFTRMGWEDRKGGDDPVMQAMRRTVDRIGRQTDAEPAVFAEAVAELEAHLEEEERAAEQAIAGPIARATKIEKQATAARTARKTIAVRVADTTLVPVVSCFLERRWVDVLTFAHLIDEERPGAVDNATQVMDELVWTVKPKATLEQRKVLIAKLPGLLTTLNKWLDAIKWQDAERLQFFADLAECHLSIVRAPLELAPERQLELAVEAAQQDALRRIAREQAEAAAEDDLARKDAAPSPVDELQRGMCLAFTQPDGSVRKVKLAWVSPLRSLFIFSSGRQQEAFSLPADKLELALRSGSARVVALEGVVGRVLTEVLQDAMNDPAPSLAPRSAFG